MKTFIRIGAAAVVLCLIAVPAFPQGPSGKWKTLNQEARSLYRKGQYTRAVVVAKKALQVAEQKAGADHPDVATSLSNLAALHYKQGQYAKAEPLYKRSLAIYEKVLGPDHPNVATILGSIAKLYRATERVAEAEVLEKRVARIRAIER
ncbi:hypothetical protein LCGC14_1443890 [marine sediment metagenome]|uniref:Uncharacterized protein n=1 Tax=marine sediment metagenome TaxID=412755 RepID=A0A0F9JJT4_9ZZZZ